MSSIKKVIRTDREKEKKEQDWNNPFNPEEAEDERDMEMFIRQKEEAERRKENLDADEREENN